MFLFVYKSLPSFTLEIHIFYTLEHEFKYLNI